MEALFCIVAVVIIVVAIRLGMRMLWSTLCLLGAAILALLVLAAGMEALNAEKEDDAPVQAERPLGQLVAYPLLPPRAESVPSTSVVLQAVRPEHIDALADLLSVCGMTSAEQRGACAVFRDRRESPATRAAALRWLAESEVAFFMKGERMDNATILALLDRAG